MARRARLWSLTLLSNLAGGWLVTFLVTTAYPDLLSTSEEVAGNYLDLGVTGAGFAAAVLAGLAITLLTWIHKSFEQVGARLVSAIAFGFLLAVVPLNHGVVASLEMFAAILGVARLPTPIGRRSPDGRSWATWWADCCW